MAFTCYTPEEAWEILVDRRRKYYNKYSAVYSGVHESLRRTADRDSFWKRSKGKKIHVPVAADIAATSADLLFGEEPRYVIENADETGTEETNEAKLKRLAQLIDLNALHPKLCEGAESASVLGGVCLKINWNDDMEYPTINIVQADNALPEYRFNEIHCMHFFSIIRVEAHSEAVWRVYERYEHGRIEMAVYRGSISELGMRQEDEALKELGYSPTIIAPVDDMLCTYIPNMKPNRIYRTSENMGRSDYEGLRDMMDALDEAYSSWMRDVRLAKSRLIVPAEYLRRKPSDMFRDGQYTYEFDEDAETLVALDIDTQKMGGGSGIQPSQFQIRTAEHAATCDQLMRNIISIAGYAPQSFGLDIHGQAESGTALHIREKKSYSTRSKKENYWKAPLERILTALIHIDSVVYSNGVFGEKDRVIALFSDSIANDIMTTANAAKLIRDAQAASTKQLVRMLHPDWSNALIDEELNQIKQEAKEAMEQANEAQMEMAQKNSDIQVNANQKTAEFNAQIARQNALYVAEIQAGKEEST